MVVEGTQGMDVHTGKRAPGLVHQSRMIRLEVDFVEKDDRLGSAAPDHREVALYTTRIKVAVNGRDYEGRVYVGSQDLSFSRASCAPTRDSTHPRQNADR